MLEVGDRVVCIRGQEGNNLYEGKEYIITLVKDGTRPIVNVKGNPIQFYASRFEKVKKSSNLRW